MTRKKEKYTIGVDFGGTNVRLGLMNSKAKIISRTCFKTANYLKSRKRLINAIIKSIEFLINEKKLSKKDILGVGIGAPGLVNADNGFIACLPNVPGWHNVHLGKIIQNRLKIKTYLDNDVNLIALGEWKYGAGKGCENLIYITLGTGVGGGLILGNKLYRGEKYASGEIGHMPYKEKGDCTCKGYGCFERFVSSTLLTAKARKIFKMKEMRLEEVYDLANKGNVRAVQFWEEVGTHVGNILVGVINLLNPKLIVLGGGISNSFKYLKGPINKIIKNRCMKVQGSTVKIVRAKLADDAGILGSSVLIRDQTIAH